MGKTVTERDILAEMLASRPPEREPGWYTCTELADASGDSSTAMSRRLASGVESGKYESKKARVQLPDRVYVTTVYRLKPTK